MACAFESRLLLRALSPAPTAPRQARLRRALGERDALDPAARRDGARRAGGAAPADLAHCEYKGSVALLGC